MYTDIHTYTYLCIKKQISEGHFNKDDFTEAQLLDDFSFFNILPLVLYIFFCSCLYFTTMKKTYLKNGKNFYVKIAN